MGNIVTREQARGMQDAHNEGYHDELPREFCPDCTGRELRSYPTAASLPVKPKSVRHTPTKKQVREMEEHAAATQEEYIAEQVRINEAATAALADLSNKENPT